MFLVSGTFSGPRLCRTERPALGVWAAVGQRLPKAVKLPARANEAR